uniref:Uncharacterized protein n=1 Tax=Psilocybe cubensis TaxID=181762 RepID=A0A8H7Y282_PSICU
MSKRIWHKKPPREAATNSEATESSAVNQDGVANTDAEPVPPPPVEAEEKPKNGTESKKSSKKNKKRKRNDRNAQDQPPTKKPRAEPKGILKFIDLNIDVLYEDRQWKTEFEKAENKDAWVEQEIAKFTKIHEHARECEKWYIAYEEYLEERKEELIMTRNVNVVNRLREMGWATEVDSILRQDPSKLYHRSLMLRFGITQCDEKVVIEQLAETFVSSLLAPRREMMQARARQVFLERRLLVLKKLVAEYQLTVAPSDVTFNMGQLCTHPEISDLLLSSPEATDPVVHLEPLRTRLPEIADKMELSMRDTVTALVKSVRGQCYHVSEDALLTLAVATFKCKRCPSSSVEAHDIRYPAVLAHRCAVRKPDGHLRAPKETPSALSITVEKLTEETPWNAYNCITYNLAAHNILTKLLARFELSPLTTHVSEMDWRDPVFECLACNDPHRGRCMLRWRAVVAHVKQKHTPSIVSEFRILDDEEAAKVKLRMDEEMARNRAKADYMGMSCSHCGQKGNPVSLREHCRTKHGIRRPSERNGDFDIALDSNTIPQIFYSWPPQEDPTDSDDD